MAVIIFNLQCIHQNAIMDYKPPSFTTEPLLPQNNNNNNNIIIIIFFIFYKQNSRKKKVLFSFLFFAADPKVPETVCLSGLNPTGVKLATGNYWFPISAFKKKGEKKKQLSFSVAASVVRLCPSHRKRSLSRTIYLIALCYHAWLRPQNPLSSKYPKPISHRAQLSHAERLLWGRRTEPLIVPDREQSFCSPLYLVFTW